MNKARGTAVLAGLALTVACAGTAPATVAMSSHAPATAAKPAAAVASIADSAGVAARSGKPRTVHVAGRQVPVDVDEGLYAMRGSLVGEWRYIPRKVLHDEPTLYVESGVEVFSGCIDRRPRDGECTGRDRRGTLNLAFLYWANFDSDGNFIKGRCVHPITGGRGAFAGARGLLRMFDTPVGDQVRTTYRGRIVLNAVPTEGDSPAPARFSAAGAAADMKTSALSGRSGC